MPFTQLFLQSQSGKALVERFYYEVWNQADENVAREILAEDFRFRGSLGPEKLGQDGFIEYMRSIHTALKNYECIINDLVISDNKVAAKMTFQGIHQDVFFGVDKTDKLISWAGAAFFTIENDRLSSLWVLGDIDSVKQQLGSGSSTSFG